jgi:predicted MFS family arabinose efflux permease
LRCCEPARGKNGQASRQPSPLTPSREHEHQIKGGGVMRAGTRWPVVLRLGVAQTLAWASSYYLPAMLAEPMARDMGMTRTGVFAAFSCAMLVSAALGPQAGRWIDRLGGRPVLVGSNLLFALGLALLAGAAGPLTLWAGWLLIGLGMGCGLYEAAFAAMVRLWGRQARSGITGITLLAGFASTVGWPLTAAITHAHGWRAACATWALLHLLLALPLNLSLPRPAPLAPTTAHPDRADPAFVAQAKPARPRLAASLLAFVFAASWFVSTAMAAHLPAVVQLSGAGLAAVVGVGALIGPAQVAGRLLEAGWLRRLHPLLSARLATLGHPLGVGVMALLGSGGASAFAILHGLGNGIMTIAKGTLPLAIFGPRGYGALQGWLMAPTRLAQAAAPLAFGAALDAWGMGALILSSALCLLALAALWWLPLAVGTESCRRGG